MPGTLAVVPVELAVPPEVAWGLPPEVAETIGLGTVSIAGLSAASEAASGFATSLILQVIT